MITISPSIFYTILCCAWKLSTSWLIIFLKMPYLVRGEIVNKPISIVNPSRFSLFSWINRQRSSLSISSACSIFRERLQVLILKMVSTDSGVGVWNNKLILKLSIKILTSINNLSTGLLRLKGFQLVAKRGLKNK